MHHTHCWMHLNCEQSVQGKAEEQAFDSPYLNDLQELHNIPVRDLLQDGHLGLQALSEFFVELVCQYLLDSHDLPRDGVPSLPHHCERSRADVLGQGPVPDRPDSSSAGPHCEAVRRGAVPTRP